MINDLLGIHGKISKKSYGNGKLKILAPTWNDKFELPDESNFRFSRLVWVFSQKTWKIDW